MFGPPGIGFQELLAIGFLLLVFFGAKKLPEIGTNLGKGFRYFKKGLMEESSSESKPQIQDESKTSGEVDSTSSTKLSNDAEVKSSEAKNSESESRKD